MHLIRFALGAAVALAVSSSYAATEPYPVEIWANVLFDTNGRPIEYALVDEGNYPTEFAERVVARVASTKIPPPQDRGKPATLRSGVRLEFLVTPTEDGRGQVRMTGLSMGPIPTQRYYASYPNDIAQTGGWEGAVEGVCTVGIDGRCRVIEVKALPGMPESVRRFTKLSLEGWSFVPQELAGQPIEGEFVLRLKLNTLDSQPVDFRQDYFWRKQGSR